MERDINVWVPGWPILMPVWGITVLPTLPLPGKEDGRSCKKVTIRMTIRKNDCRSNTPVCEGMGISGVEGIGDGYLGVEGMGDGYLRAVEGMGDGFPGRWREWGMGISGVEGMGDVHLGGAEGMEK